MKKITIAFLGSLISLISVAQDSMYNRFQNNTDSIAMELVKMAMENPIIKNAEALTISTEYSYKMSRTMWMNNITAMGNINEFSINPSAGPSTPINQSTLYPRYNFGIVLPLGILVNNKKQSKSEYYRYVSLVEQAKIQRQNLTVEVKTLYYDYLLNRNLKALQQEIINDYQIIQVQNEQKFKKGDISLETFGNANTLYNNSLIRMMTIDHDLEIIRAKLESLIGMSIDEALRQITTTRVK